MIEMWIIFIVWGFVCFKIGFQKGATRGVQIGVETTMMFVASVVDTEQILKITKLAKEVELGIDKQKTGQ